MAFVSIVKVRDVGLGPFFDSGRVQTTCNTREEGQPVGSAAGGMQWIISLPTEETVFRSPGVAPHSRLCWPFLSGTVQKEQ